MDDDRKREADAQAPTEARGLGDLLGDKAYLARLEQRQTKEARQRGEEERQRAAEARALEPYGALVGLARLAGEDPNDVLAKLKEGGVLARLLKYMLDIERQKKKTGPKEGAKAAERWAVVHWLQAAGHRGDDLDRAIVDVAGSTVTAATYRRSAVRFRGSTLAALFEETEAVGKARDLYLSSAKGE